MGYEVPPWGDPAREPLQRLERSQHERGASVEVGLGEAIEVQPSRYRARIASTSAVENGEAPRMSSRPSSFSRKRRK